MTLFPMIGSIRLYPVCPECGHPQDQVKDIEDERDALKAENERLKLLVKAMSDETPRCKKCGCPYPSDVCPDCGNKAVDPITCRNCGHPSYTHNSLSCNWMKQDEEILEILVQCNCKGFTW